MTRRSLLPAVLFAALGPAAALAQPAPPRIAVGPNMLVSRDGDFPHVELQLAANPKNAKNLVGGAITYTRPEGGFACRAYATHDGGSTWKASEFAPQNEWGGGDPYVAFTPQGTAVFCALTLAKDEKGQMRGFLHVWRSEDGGSSWGDMSDLGYSYDFQKMTADPTTGRFAGRLYIAALHGYPEYLVSVFRSEDDGRTWRGPVQAVSGRGEKGVGAVNAVVLSDGTLVLPIVEYEFKPGKIQRAGKVWRPMSLVLSTDGGVSFGPQRKAPATLWDMDDPAWRRAVGNAQFAADTSSAAYRDRLYMVWPDSRHGRYRLLFARSSNRGANWSEPVLLNGDVPADSLQFQVAIAVNKDGVVGVSWYDTRDVPDGSGFDEYFTASVDGGKSFLPPVRVSSDSSRFVGQGNLRMDPIVSGHKDELYMSLLSAGSRWGNGGDYMGLAAGADGAFFPFWADSRTGTFQMYTARVTVEIPPKEGKSAGEVTPPAGTPRARRGVSEGPRRAGLRPDAVRHGRRARPKSRSACATSPRSRSIPRSRSRSRRSTTTIPTSRNPTRRLRRSSTPPTGRRAPARSSTFRARSGPSRSCPREA